MAKTSNFMNRFLADEVDYTRPFVGNPKGAFRIRQGAKSPLVYMTNLQHEGGWHLVDSAVLDEVQLPNLWRGYLYEGVMENGRPFLLPVTQGSDPDYEDWAKSLLAAIKQASKGWVEISSDRSVKKYRTTLLDLHQSPEWYDGDFDELMMSAFEGKIIDKSHPLLKRKRTRAVEFDDIDETDV